MRKPIAALLIAAQAIAVPAAAATLEPVEAVQARSGAFAGARLRIGLGGREAGKARAGLMVGPQRLSLAADGRIRTSIGEGVEFGFAPGGRPRLSVAGRSMQDYKLAAEGKGGGGIPTGLLIAGGVVLIVAAAALVTYDAIGDAATE